MRNKRKRRLLLITARFLGITLHYTTFTAASTLSSLGAQFDGTNFFIANIHTEGSIFEIVTKNKPIAVTRFDINIDANTDTIQVRSRTGIPGTVVALGNAGLRLDYFLESNNAEDGEWPIIGTFPNVLGQGKNNITSLPEFDEPVLIPPYSKQTFYITTSYGGDLQQKVTMWYNMGSKLGNVYASNDDIEILEGHAVGSQNGYIGWSTPRLWNGIVHYYVLDEPSTSPSQMPSLGPSYSPTQTLTPTIDITTSPSQTPSLASYSPSYTPTQITTTPSLQPTQTPSSTTPTMGPTSSSRPTATQSSTNPPSNEDTSLSLPPTKSPSANSSVDEFISSPPTQGPQQEFDNNASYSPTAVPSSTKTTTSSPPPVVAVTPTQPIDYVNVTKPPTTVGPTTTASPSKYPTSDPSRGDPSTSSSPSLPVVSDSKNGSSSQGPTRDWSSFLPKTRPSASMKIDRSGIVGQLFCICSALIFFMLL